VAAGSSRPVLASAALRGHAVPDTHPYLAPPSCPSVRAASAAKLCTARQTLVICFAFSVKTVLLSPSHSCAMRPRCVCRPRKPDEMGGASEMQDVKSSTMQEDVSGPAYPSLHHTDTRLAACSHHTMARRVHRRCIYFLLNDTLAHHILSFFTLDILNDTFRDDLHQRREICRPGAWRS
jgi:hypothetical protein